MLRGLRPKHDKNKKNYSIIIYSRFQQVHIFEGALIFFGMYTFPEDLIKN